MAGVTTPFSSRREKTPQANNPTASTRIVQLCTSHLAARWPLTTDPLGSLGSGWRVKKDAWPLAAGQQPELFEDGKLVPVLTERADPITVELGHGGSVDSDG